MWLISDTTAKIFILVTVDIEADDHDDVTFRKLYAHDHAPAPRLHPPCLPSKADRPPTGPLWVHEIKHETTAGVRREYEEERRATNCDRHRIRVASGAHRCRADFRNS